MLKIKRIGMTVMACILGMAVLGACSGNNPKISVQPSVEVVDEDLLPSEYATLPEIKGKEITVPESSVSEEDIIAEIQKSWSLSEDESREIEDGDVILITYEGLISGESFPSSVGTDITMEVGKNSIFKEFDESVIGMKAGEKKVVSLTFDKDNAPADDFEGKTADYRISIDGIYEKEDISEDMIAQKKAEADAADESAARQQAAQEIWETALAETEFKCIPKSVYEGYLDTYEESLLNQYSCNDIDEYLEILNMTREDYETAAVAFAEKNTKSEILLSLLVDKFGIDSSGETFQAEEKVFLESIDMDEKEAISKYGEPALKRSVLYRLVLNELGNLPAE